jgi:hypothetical protein
MEPRYQGILQDQFYNLYKRQFLKLQPGLAEAEFEQEVIGARNRRNWMIVASAAAILCFDIKVWVPIYGVERSIQRLACISVLTFPALILTKIVSHSDRKNQLIKELTLKYEREVFDLDPGFEEFCKGKSPKDQGNL